MNQIAAASHCLIINLADVYLEAVLWAQELQEWIVISFVSQGGMANGKLHNHS